MIYTAIDRKHPGTTSKKVIKLIRGEIGFQGLLMTDDLSMKALSGDFGDRTSAALKAGCDVVLHCNGDMAEMQAVARAAPKLAGKAKQRAEAAMARVVKTPEPLRRGRAAAPAAFGTRRGGTSRHALESRRRSADRASVVVDRRRYEGPLHVGGVDRARRSTAKILGRLANSISNRHEAAAGASRWPTTL